MALERVPVQQPKEELTSNFCGVNVAKCPVSGGHLVLQVKYPFRELLVDTWRLSCQESSKFACVKSYPFVTLFFTTQPVTFWSHDQVHIKDNDVFFNRPLPDVFQHDSWQQAPHYAAMRGVALPSDLIPQIQGLLAEFTQQFDD